MFNKALVFTFLFVSAFSANAALVSRLGGLAYYDTEADLTWLADATSGATGRMTWQDSMDWVANLSVDGVDGWRLADTLQPDASCAIQSSSSSYGYDCSGSELGNMFYNVLGGQTGWSITDSHNANFDLFSNISTIATGRLWSETTYSASTTEAWAYAMQGGYQSTYSKGGLNKSYAWAVQSGDVSAVPVPAAAWLFGSALLSLAGLKRRK